MDDGKQALVVETINKLASAGNAKQKVQHLEQLEELLLRNEPALLDVFLSELEPLQVDKAVSVRRKLLEFLAAAVRVRPSPAVLGIAAPCVNRLLSDEQSQLAREAAQAAHTLLDKAMLMLTDVPQGDAAAAAAWSSVQALQQDLSSKAGSLAGSPGGVSSRQLALCLAGIKMSEQAVLRYTADSSSSLPQAQALAAQAHSLLQSLVQLLAVKGVRQRAGPVVVGAIKALAACCQQRPQLVATALPPLLALAQQVIFTVPKPDDQQSGVDASCGAALKDVLVRVNRSNSEACKPWLQQLHQALMAMGADAAAAAAARHLERLAARGREGHKRKAADQQGREAKVPRAGTPAAADSTPARTPTPTPAPGPPAGGGVDFPTDVMALFRPAPGANMYEALNNAQQVLEVLVNAQQHQAVEAILSTVAPEVLAELVLRWMDNLPDQPEPPAAQTAAQPQPQPAAAAAGGQTSPAADAGFMTMGFAQYLQQAVQPQQQQQQQAQAAVRQREPTPPHAAPAAAAVAPMAAGSSQQPQQQQQQPQQAVDPRRKAAAAAAAAAAAGPRPAAPPAAPQLPTPLPMALRPEQVASMRTAAVQRILCATRNKPIWNFRELLLSRLASRAAEADGLTDLMLRHVLTDYHTNRGHLLLVRWLYALAAVAVEAEQQQQQQPAAAPEPHAAAEPSAAAAAAAGSAGGGHGSVEGSSRRSVSTEGQEPPGDAAAHGDTAMPDAPSLNADTAAGVGETAAAAAGVGEAAAAGVAEAAAAGVGEAAAAAAGVDQAGDVAAQGGGHEAAAGPTGAPEQSEAAQQQTTRQDSQQHELIDRQRSGKQHQQQSQQQQQQDLSQQGGAGSHPAGHRHPGADLSGSAYESVLMASLRGLQEKLPSTDPAIPRLLQDAPVLPLPAVSSFLQDLMSEGTEWAAMGLSTAYALFESRPVSRALLLQLMLDAAVCHDSATREKAVGLVVSKLMGWEQHAAAVVEFATAQLLLLLQPLTQEQQQQQGGQDQQPQQEKQEKQQPGPQHVNGVQQDKQQQPSGPGEAAGGATGPVEASVDGAAAAHPQCMDVEAAAQHSMLYLSLCTLKPDLLRLLLQTYGKAGPDARAAMSRYAPSLALAIGSTQPALLELIRVPPEGSLDLLLTMITALADQQMPPEPLVAACAAHFKATGSVQLLGPVVVSLTKENVIKLLPQLLLQLPDQRLRLLYRRLALPSHGRQPLFAPVDLLVLLHRLEFSAEEWNKHKQHIMMAVDRAMRTPEVFPAAVMQTAITRMESLSPTPRLFMRSVNIMVTNAAAPLVKWVLELLQRLISKQVWKSKAQWKGFLVCCEKLQDQGSALVLLQLPNNVLQDALEQLPRSVWKKLYEAANTPGGCQVPVYAEIRRTVDTYYEKWGKAEIEHRQAELAARQAALAAAGGTGTAAGAAAGIGGSGIRLARTSTGGAAAGAKLRPKSGSSTVKAAAAAGGGAAAGAQPKPVDTSQHQQQQPGTGVQGQVHGSVANEPGEAAGSAGAHDSSAQAQTLQPTAAPEALQQPTAAAAAGAAQAPPEDDDEFELDFEDSE